MQTTNSLAGQSTLALCVLIHVIIMFSPQAVVILNLVATLPRHGSRES